MAVFLPKLKIFVLYIWNRDTQDRNFNGKSGVFDHAELGEIVPGDCDNRKW